MASASQARRQLAKVTCSGFMPRIARVHCLRYPRSKPASITCSTLAEGRQWEMGMAVALQVLPGRRNADLPSFSQIHDSTDRTDVRRGIGGKRARARMVNPVTLVDAILVR